jgi:hypothetical protein
VVERGAQLVNNLPGENSDLDGRLGGKAKFLCAFTLIDDKISIVTRVSGGAEFERLQMLRCTLNLSLG